LNEDGDVDRVSVDFFSDGGLANGSLGWLCRLACVLLPITVALVVGAVGFVRTDS
jgi:hypothetical protein